jgi:hypothetical protein
MNHLANKSRRRYKYSRRLVGMVPRFLILLVVSAIIVAAWYAFLAIVAPPPIPTTPALVMVWSSAIILLFALFPQILDRVKKLKIKDFELELQPIINRATSNNIIISKNYNNIFVTKGGLGKLSGILYEALSHPGKPIILVADLKQNEYIDIRIFYIYLYSLYFFGSSVVVLFIYTGKNSQASNLGSITTDSVIGAVNGRSVLQELLRRKFSLLKEIVFPDYNGLEAAKFCKDLSSKSDQFMQQHSEYLTLDYVCEWFKSELSSYQINAALTALDLELIRNAISESKEYLLIVEENKVSSVVPICLLTRDISRRALQEMQ